MDKRLYDIYTKSNVALSETRMIGTILIDKEGHFEGIIGPRDSIYHNQLVTGDILSEKDYGLVELTIFRSKGDKRPSLRLEGEKSGFRFLGKSFLKTNEVKVECGDCSVVIQDGDMIREVTDEEIDSVEERILRAIENLNEDSLTQYMGQSEAKKYRKEMQKR